MQKIIKNIPRLVKVKRLGCLSLLGLFIALTPYASFALPQDGVVAIGSADINYNGSNLAVNQHSDRALIDWRSFDIGSSESVNFNQPGSGSIAINRVNNANPTNILGTLKANGKVVLVNPNGVFFGQGSVVDVSGITATTADIDNTNFATGKLDFNKPGNPNAKIVNEGSITVKQAGLVAFVAPTVENSGVIKAQLGKVHLGAGDNFSMDLNGDGITKIGVSENVLKQMVAQDGIVEANGGEVHITTASASHAVDSLIKHTGVTRANSVEQKNGVIRLSAGKTGGSSKVEVSGNVSAKGTNAGEKGGSVAVTAKNVKVKQGALIDVSGADGGGEALIGGDYKGGEYLGDSLVLADVFNNDEFIHAENVIVENGAVIDATSGLGDGGRVILWSDEATSHAGNINAYGVGKGGFVETSSKGFLSVSGFVNAGKGGSWLLDPRNVIISGGWANNVPGTGGDVIPNADDYVVSAESISAALSNGNNVTITTGIDGSQDGDITMSYASINKNGGGEATLTLKAARDITISNSYITSSSNELNVVLSSDIDGNDVGGVKLDNVNMTTNNGDLIIGGNDPFTNAAGAYSANSEYSVVIEGGNINTAAGNIFVNGNSGSDEGATGVLVRYGKIITTTGDIEFVGHSNASKWGTGVKLYAKDLETVTGAITLTGTVNVGQGTIVEYYSNIISTGTGADVGAINIYGEGYGQNSFAVGLNNGKIIVADAAVSLTGIHLTEDSTSDRTGVSLSNGAVIQSTGNSEHTGNITIIGEGGVGYRENYGVRIENSSIETVDASMMIDGEAGKTSWGHNTEGVALYNNAKLITSGAGNISLHGIGHGIVTSNNNSGIRLDSGVEIATEGTGEIDLTGVAGGGSDSAGVKINGASVTSADGKITIDGSVDNTEVGPSRKGVLISSGATVSGGNGEILITGVGGNGDSSSNNHGVELSYASKIISTGTANLVISGNAGDSTNNSNHGVLIDSSSIELLSGGVSIEGIGGGIGVSDYNDGLLLQNGSTIKTDGAGDITIDATAGNGSHSMDVKTANATNNISTGLAGSTINFIANKFELNNLNVYSAGDVHLKTRTSGLSIGVAGSVGQVNYSVADLQKFDAAGKLIIGDAATSEVKLGAWSVSGKTHGLEVNGQAIMLEGDLNFSGANDILLNVAASDFTLGHNVETGGGITFNTADSYSINVDENVNVNAGNGITLDSGENISVAEGVSISTASGNVNLLAAENIELNGSSSNSTIITSDTGDVVLVADNKLAAGTSNINISENVELSAVNVRLYAPDRSYALNGTINGVTMLDVLTSVVFETAYDAGHSGTHLYLKMADDTPTPPEPSQPPTVIDKLPEQVFSHTGSRQMSYKMVENLNRNDVIKKGNDTVPLGNSVFDMPLSKMTWQVLINDTLVKADTKPNSHKKANIKISSL
jgi:filamentous hemagglutinin family protein